MQPPEPQHDSNAVEVAAQAFIAEIRRYREIRGLSQKKLGKEMGYDPSYISKIENGKEPPTRDFAKRADEILATGGSIFRLLREYETARATGPAFPAHQSKQTSEPDTVSVTSSSALVVVHEDAELQYDQGLYRLRIQRVLRNAGDIPVTRFLIRIAVDKHPETAERSNELYRQRPLTWQELQLDARCEDEQMAIEVKHDRDAFKEVWLLFENPNGKFPLYPNDTTRIEYSYTVSAQKWGHWFQRAVRLPTERLSVRLIFPAQMKPTVWGLETSMTAQSTAVKTPIVQTNSDNQQIFTWSTDTPELHTRFRFEWRFRTTHQPPNREITPSEQMRAIGIMQQGNPILEQQCKPFDLPKEADLAREIGEKLLGFLPSIKASHIFGKGVGLAAPQIGIARAVAVVECPHSDPLVLYNPTIINESPETDTQYEGCLSLFDVRGKVARSLHVQVQHTTLDGVERITQFDTTAARLWAHEIDHLHGDLYVSKMAANAELIPVEYYTQVGKTWEYPTS